MELQDVSRPLVPQNSSRPQAQAAQSAELQPHESYCGFTFLLSCFKEITYKSIPRILNYEFNLMTMSLINIYLLGQKGNLKDIKTFGLGDAFARIFAYSLIKYKNMTLQQQCTIALSAKNHRFVGIYYQRSLFIVGVICILSAPFLCFWWKALQIFGIDEDISNKASDYMWVCLPSIFSFGYYDTTNNYLQAQNVLWPQIGIQFLQVIMHYFLSHFLIIENDMGLRGAAWAKNFSDFSSAALIYAFISYKNPTPKTWIEWDSKAFANISKYLKESIRNGIGQYLEEVAFLSLTMMAMYLDVPENTATHIALQNSGLFHFNFYLGIHFVINNFVNSSLSRGFVERAKRRAFMSIVTSLIFISIALFILLNNKSQWSQQFSSNPSVQKNLQDSVYLYAKIVLCDGLQLTFCAILKALDLFKQITYIYTTSYYLIGLTTSAYLGFYKGQGEIGIWSGWLYSAFISFLIFIIVVVTTNWQKQYENIRIRNNREMIVIANFQRQNQ